MRRVARSVRSVLHRKRRATRPKVSQTRFTPEASCLAAQGQSGLIRTGCAVRCVLVQNTLGTASTRQLQCLIHPVQKGHDFRSPLKVWLVHLRYSYTEFKEQYIKINKDIQDINENDFQFSYETEADRIYLSFRMNNSKLQNDRFKYNMCNTPICQNCGMMKNETVHHYIFECPKYKIIRKILDRKIKSLAKIKNKSTKFILNLLLTKNEGNLLTNTEFRNLTMSLKYYILRTHRFI